MFDPLDKFLNKPYTEADLFLLAERLYFNLEVYISELPWKIGPNRPYVGPSTEIKVYLGKIGNQFKLFFANPDEVVSSEGFDSLKSQTLTQRQPGEIGCYQIILGLLNQF